MNFGKKGKGASIKDSHHKIGFSPPLSIEFICHLPTNLLFFLIQPSVPHSEPIPDKLKLSNADPLATTALNAKSPPSLGASIFDVHTEGRGGSKRAKIC